MIPGEKALATNPKNRFYNRAMAVRSYSYVLFFFFSILSATSPGYLTNIPDTDNFMVQLQRNYGDIEYDPYVAERMDQKYGIDTYWVLNTFLTGTMHVRAADYDYILMKS